MRGGSGAVLGAEGSNNGAAELVNREGSLSPGHEQWHAKRFSHQAQLRWYVAQTQPHADARAASNLERQGFDVFCPRFQKSVRHARQRVRKLAPLFPGYLFVAIDVTRDPWRRVNGTFGVVRIVMQGDSPLPVPVGIVESLQARVKADGAIDCAPALKVGQSVRIADGPFADLVGTLASLDGAGRVRVLLDLLGGPVPVVLGSELLLPAA